MKKNILITGSEGFIGKNLLIRLKESGAYNLLCFDQNDTPEILRNYLEQADVIFHLAGVNRPKDAAELENVNAGLTKEIIDILKQNKSTPKIIFSSSIQAELNNLYGHSKKNAEEALIAFSKTNACAVKIYRLANVFGKWCRPNYNSVVATFCYNIANELPIKVDDPEKQLNLIYIDDIINDFIKSIEEEASSFNDFSYIAPVFTVTLGDLSDKIRSFRLQRVTLVLPDFSDDLTKRLYTTYLSYLPENEFSYKLNSHCDERGNLTELIKSPQFGQIFISTTKPGIIRGNHYHHSKVEKFCVVKGKARINFRKIDSEEIISYEITSDEMRVVDIPPGYTHNIENTGEEEMIVLFWANEMFSKDNPDTIYLKV